MRADDEVYEFQRRLLPDLVTDEFLARVRETIERKIGSPLLHDDDRKTLCFGIVLTSPEFTEVVDEFADNPLWGIIYNLSMIEYGQQHGIHPDDDVLVVMSLGDLFAAGHIKPLLPFAYCARLVTGIMRAGLALHVEEGQPWPEILRTFDDDELYDLLEDSYAADLEKGGSGAIGRVITAGLEKAWRNDNKRMVGTLQQARQVLDDAGGNFLDEQVTMVFYIWSARRLFLDYPEEELRLIESLAETAGVPGGQAEADAYAGYLRNHGRDNEANLVLAFQDELRAEVEALDEFGEGDAEDDEIPY